MPSPAGPSNSVTEVLLQAQRELSDQAQAAEAEAARFSAEQEQLDTVEVSVELLAPSRRHFYLEPAALDVVQGFIQHYVSQPEGGCADVAASLSEYLRDLTSDSVQRAREAGAGSACG